MIKAKQRTLKLRNHAYLTEMDMRRIHFYRFGTEKPSELHIRSYKEVS